MEGNIFSPRVLDHRMTAKFKIDFRLFAIFEVGRARRKGEAEEDMAPNDGTKLSWPLRATD